MICKIIYPNLWPGFEKFMKCLFGNNEICWKSFEMADVESLARVGQRSRRIPNHIDFIMLWEILARETLGPRTPTTVIMILTFQISLFAQLRFFSFIFFFHQKHCNLFEKRCFFRNFHGFFNRSWRLNLKRQIPA